MLWVQSWVTCLFLALMPLLLVPLQPGSLSLPPHPHWPKPPLDTQLPDGSEVVLITLILRSKML